MRIRFFEVLIKIVTVMMCLLLITVEIPQNAFFAEEIDTSEVEQNDVTELDDGTEEVSEEGEDTSGETGETSEEETDEAGEISEEESEETGEINEEASEENSEEINIFNVKFFVDNNGNIRTVYTDVYASSYNRLLNNQYDRISATLD